MKPAKPLKLTCAKVQTGAHLPLPGSLRATTRSSGASEVDPLLAGLTVDTVYTLGAATRGESMGQVQTLDPGQPVLLALEAEDGVTLFIRSDTLAETVGRLRPEAEMDDVVDFSQFRDPNAAARGLGDVLWKVVTALSLPADELWAEAQEQALAWARAKMGGEVEAKAYGQGSFLGAKALMWKIESRLVGRPGLYCWHDQILDPSDLCQRNDDARLCAVAAGKPALVLIHGTGSYTLGSYADLRADKATWSQLTQRFPGGIFGFEHRTFSESPVENALALLNALPNGARVSLVTHSRGGLVGDLLCLGRVDDQAIEAYRNNALDVADREGLEWEAREEQDRLRDIRDRLAAGHITVERYVRVACPARGTRLLSENLDVALSDFLNLLQWGGSALVAASATALGGPVAGERFGKGASSCLGVLKRLVLEIAGRRIDPHLVPGIAAMRTDSPLAAFLAHPGVHRRDGVQMAVIAGDTEFDGLGLSNLGRRIANLFCDWRLFDRNDNDLVVDTDSMYAGLGFRGETWYQFNQDASVTHFRYFFNKPTRDALCAWLTAEETGGLSQFQRLTGGSVVPWSQREALAAQRGGPEGARPVVIFLPGIMGSYIEADRTDPDQPGSGSRIWFDVAKLFAGQLERIRDPNAPNVAAEDMFEMFYGDLADHLAATHKVIRCPYDWRCSLAQGARLLKAKIELAASAHPGQPIRLLAHGMGGLVVRTLMHKHPEAWGTVLASGGRLVMLGTPNNGSHLIVHTLMGKSDSMRKLERMDATHDLQQILEIIAGFPGALALLPRPNGFVDAGAVPGVIPPADYYQQANWLALQEKNTDHWYGDNIGGVPAQSLLNKAWQDWEDLPHTLPNPERAAHVFGQSDKTPCGVQKDEKGRLKRLFTAEGDGSVTWESGRRLGGMDLDARCWIMPVEHADLTGEEEYFPAIVELLEQGVTDRLKRLPRQRGEAAHGFVLEAEPPVVSNGEELARAFLGSGPRRRKPARGKQVLKVSVRAGDIRFLDQPVLCGHYIGDAISGAEATLDRMLGGALSERERLGVYASHIGTQAIVLHPPNREELQRGSLPGAVIVGLGPFTGQLSARQVSETVRAAVLRFLLHRRDALYTTPEARVSLYSLLIGWNSTASISVADAVAAVTRGVLEANGEFRDGVGKRREQDVAVTELCFIELYRDAAISAAHAVRALPETLANELKGLRARIEPAPALEMGEGVLDRLTVTDDPGYWSRLIATDADANEAEPVRPALPGDARYYPARLKYVFLSRRARAETVEQQRQPGLIEAIISDQLHNPGYDAKLGHTLFQLMVPLDYMAVVREQSRLLLVLDSYTANLPWELLRDDGEALVLRIPMVRQLATSRYRTAVRTANTDTACLIAAPSTFGFNQRFPGDQEKLADLPGAAEEAYAIRESLRKAGWNDSDIVVSPPDKAALDIFADLYQHPYRLLVICAHGIFEAKALDGRTYSGVVLSGGLLITAVEINQMEVVPEVVFLSCCHLGSVSNPYSQPNRLAYSLASELIEMGVRCVVAAGWAVDDAAANTFASTFFDRLTQGEAFGDAIFAARRATKLRHPGSNTWGAYQAYGDPGYRLHPALNDAEGRKDRRYVAVEELLAELQRRRVSNRQCKGGVKPPSLDEQSRWVGQQLAQCPSDWMNRPDVLQAMGEFYGELGEDGFNQARTAYQRAIQREDTSGRVAVRTIEQLASMEASHGGRLSDAGQFDQAMRLIDSAIHRLNALAESVKGEGAVEMNAERAALLGSALKRKAATLAMKPSRSWKRVSACLGQAALAYQSAVATDPAQSPYNTLNWLLLEWLAGPADRANVQTAAIARRCGEAVRERFVVSKDFRDAVMSADAEMTAWLLDGELPEAEPGSPPAVALHRRYEEAVVRVPKSVRQWDSVVRQWRLLARFLHQRNQGNDRDRARVMEDLAQRHDSQSS